MVEIDKIKLTQIKKAEYNPRTISEENYAKLKNSVKNFGLVEPILINLKNNTIISGHQRYDVLTDLILTDGNLAEKEFHLLKYGDLGLILDTDEPTLENEDYEKALNITLNNTNLTGEYNFEKLSSLLEDLEVNDFDLELTGFNGLEDIDFDGFDWEQEETTFTDKDYEVVEDNYETGEVLEVTVQDGDLYKLGNHFLLCGDSTVEADVSKLMNGAKADMVFTDPPYNVDYSNIERPKPSKKDLGKIKNDVMDNHSFYNFLVDIYTNLDNFTNEDSSFYIWYANKSTIEFYTALKNTNIKLNQMIIWKKPMLLGRGRYQWAHEPCIFAIKGSPYFTEDRTKTTVWDFGGYDKSHNMHPTQKPLFLPTEAIENSSKENDVVLDLFGGSGSTLIACEQLNRQCYMMELDPYYCQVIINRWEEFTGEKAEKIN